MNLTLKSLPDSVYLLMKQAAKDQGRSLNSHIVQVLQAEAAEIERKRRLGTTIRKMQRFTASLPPMSDSSALIRKDRER